MAFLTVNFISKSLMRTVPVNVILPADKLVFPGMPEPEDKPFKLMILLHGILGLLPKNAGTRGSLKVFGKEISAIPEKEQRAMRGEKMAIIFQDTGRYMNPISRIGRQFRQYLKVHRDLPPEKMDEMAAELLRRMHLTDAERVLN